MLSQFSKYDVKLSKSWLQTASHSSITTTMATTKTQKFPSIYRTSRLNNSTSGKTSTTVDTDNDSKDEVDDPFNMHIVCDLGVIPIGLPTTSVSKEIAIVQKIIERSGLEYMMHGYGTNIEGKWDDVMTLIKEIHTELHEMYDVPRISTSIKLGTRTDKKSTIKGKIASAK